MTKNIISRSSTIPVLAALAVVAIVPSSYAENELPVVGSADTSHSDWGDSTVNVNQVEVSEDGGYAIVAWTVNNDGGSNINLTDFWHATYLYQDNGTAGVVLVDDDNGIRYNAVRDSAERCLCSGVFTRAHTKAIVKSGQSATYWASYILREEAEEVTIEIPGFEPITDVAVE
ncbi:hypothetical protein [Allosalinactinospora lopnorensis]|uniref:hypothetical protein n=1 Tax=Allosalinactinospora lopnorensis TaxID=1352348 RepID=UPI0012E157EC|nr:hypothetical protein [Allosalinactinospora lopnorensis]